MYGNNKGTKGGSIVCMLLLFALVSMWTGTKTAEAKIKPFIWLGDSRTVGIETIAADSEDTFLADGGQSYDWFASSTVPRLKSLLDANPYQVVIFHYGVNDCANRCVGVEDTKKKYVNELNELMKSYPYTEFIFATVTPVDGPYPTAWLPEGEIDPDTLNHKIRVFNRYIRKYCDMPYINTYGYCVKRNLQTYDGIHYASENNTKIYRYIKAKYLQIRKGN